MPVKMVKRSGRIAIAVALVPLALTACSKNGQSTAPAAVYSVNFSPSFKIGQKFSLVSEVSEKNHSRILLNLAGVPTPQNDYRDLEFSGRIAGEGEILGVFPNGGIQKMALLIQTFDAAKDGVGIPKLPVAGTKIIASREGSKIAISVDGQAADATVTAAINEFLPLDDEKYSLQELYGPPKPVSVGADWPINSVGLGNSLVDSGIAAEANGARGNMKFESIKDGIETLSGIFTIDSFKLPLPTTMTIDSGTITVSLSCQIPISTVNGKLKVIKSLSTKTQAHGEVSGANMKLEITGQQTRETSISLH